ncbi:hypothetical protein [Chthonobacter albigriseus]|uniref:hypothetical protein n=1 Tax=Chthonobacter albigriseus TaxID=1683161 RepID=UPI0015EFB385|nr:hypothetical protein [Chthonobacter albigriseus]
MKTLTVDFNTLHYVEMVVVNENFNDMYGIEVGERVLLVDGDDDVVAEGYLRRSDFTKYVVEIIHGTMRSTLGDTSGTSPVTNIEPK